MAIFRCKRSGNTVSFKLEHDIDSMRKHEGYEEVKDEIKTETVTAEVADTKVPEESIVDNPAEKREEKPKVLKQRGRPKVKK